MTQIIDSFSALLHHYIYSNIRYYLVILCLLLPCILLYFLTLSVLSEHLINSTFVLKNYSLLVLCN